MAWLYLIIASLFEVGWPLGFKLADIHRDKFWLFIALSIVSMSLSGLFLYLAQRTIPISTAYIVWTGIGAICTFIIGLIFFSDTATILRMFFALLILVGVAGMELTAK
jgi:quaternary ammonium compound-resistance protein SugE